MVISSYECYLYLQLMINSHWLDSVIVAELCPCLWFISFSHALWHGMEGGGGHDLWACELVLQKAISSSARPVPIMEGLQHLCEGTSEWLICWLIYMSENSICQKNVTEHWLCIVLITGEKEVSIKSKVSKITGQTHIFPEHIAIVTNNKWRESSVKYNSCSMLVNQIKCKSFKI